MRGTSGRRGRTCTTDPEFVSWGHEYVTLQPDQFGCVNTTIRIEIRRCVTVRVDLRFNLRERT